MERKQLPNATAVLILGICSILTCCCYGIVGLILGVVALILARKDMKLYLTEPEAYTNYANLNIGRILAIIGTILSALCLLAIIYISVTWTEDELREFQENLELKIEQQESQE